MGSCLPLGDHLNAEREGKRRKPCRIWADGGSATIRSKSVWKIRLERMAGNPATCGYSDGILFAHFLSTKKPLTFPTSGRSGGEGVHFSIEWALGEWCYSSFRRMGPDGAERPDGAASGRPGRPRRHASGSPAAERSRCSARTCRGSRLHACGSAGESTRCCDKTFRINDTEQYRVR